MGRFCFVILHYQTLSDTIGCVNSILSNVEYPDYRIIIVDNGSPNKSGNKLKETFENNPLVNVILSERNLGFTSGNNLGYDFAKKEFGPEFIALINNDTIIEQSDFITVIKDKFSKTYFDILGPDIYTPNGRHQSPAFNKMSGMAAVDKYIRFYSKVLLLNYLGLDYIFEKIKKHFFPVSSLHTENIYIIPDSSKEQTGVMLHGSALVFSARFIEKYDGLYPGPFMYGEEAILDFIARRDNLLVLYSPDVKIIHLDDSATNSIYKKPLMKRRFYLKNFLRSSRILKRLMKEHSDVG
jgi:GT2 family glycosyltransferase